MATLQYSAFDSAIFGLRFLRVTAFDVSALADEIAAEPYDVPLVIDAKIPASDSATIDALRGLGFEKAATMVELSWQARALHIDLPHVETELQLSADDLTAHAEQFIYQRFYQDPRISRSATVKLMHTWIANSLGGRRKSVSMGRNFCTYALNDDRVTIDLLSCIDRGQGIAAQLLVAVQGIAVQTGLPAVHVTTEAENMVALKTYVRAGFVPCATAVALHFVRDVQA